MILNRNLNKIIKPVFKNVLNKTGFFNPVTVTLQAQFTAFQDGLKTSKVISTPTSKLSPAWFDISGNGNDGIEANPALQATYNPVGINCRPAVEFGIGGGNKGFILPSSLFTIPDNDNTIFCVSVTNSITAFQRFIVGVDPGNIMNYGFAYNRGPDDSFTWVNSNSFTILRDTATGGVTTPHILTATRAGVARSLSINGATPITDNLGSSPGDIEKMDIGRRNTVNPQGLIGFIGEILIYNSLLSAENIALVEAYLSGKWGIDLV